MNRAFIGPLKGVNVHFSNKLIDATLMFVYSSSDYSVSTDFRVVFCVIFWNPAAFLESLCNAVFGILEAGFLSCSFDQGLCDWIQHKEGDVHWETVPDPSGKCFTIL